MTVEKLETLVTWIKYVYILYRIGTWKEIIYNGGEMVCTIYIVGAS